MQVPAQGPLPTQAGRMPCGGVPAGIGTHMPSEPATSQASQVPVQGALQHTPSTQVPPSRHMLPPVQGPPRGIPLRQLVVHIGTGVVRQ